jgi:hypothetical protein
MEITGTREAFTALIQERGIYKRLGVKPPTVSTWKQYLREGKLLSLDKMEEILLKAGASVVSEKVWEVEVDRSAEYAMKMKPYFDAINSAYIDDTVSVDYNLAENETAIDNELNKRAGRLHCRVARDDSKRPIVKYKFVK